VKLTEDADEAAVFTGSTSEIEWLDDKPAR
jgi:hypothetical protein